MARIDRVRENYEDVTERLFSDNKAFADYLKFAGKFFKLPSAQTMTIYGSNPNATMVADFDTWKKFNRYVKRGTNSIAVLDNGSLKHYFDISQTNGSKIPYQWSLDKDKANALIDEAYEQSGIPFKSFSGVVNYLGSERALENIGNVMNTLNIPEESRAKFEKSYTSMVQYLIAARCELGSNFKYNGKLDLSALDMLHSKAEKERLCEFVQITGKSVLLSLEKSINNIVMQERTVENNGRNQADLVRGGQEILSRNQDGERENVQARPDNVRVPGASGNGSDGRGTGVDERADRSMGREMAEADDGTAPRTDTVITGSASVGTDTASDRQRSVGVPADVQSTVREEIPASDRVHGVESVGEHVRSDSGQRDNGNGSAGSHRVSDEGGATYSTENTEQTAEEDTPAVSFSDADLEEISDIARSNAMLGIADDILALNRTVAAHGGDISLDSYLGERAANTRVHIMNMLTIQNYKPLRDYLNAVYGEAYNNHYMIEAGTAAQTILGQIDALSKAVNKDAPELPVGLDKFYVDKENNSVTWAYFDTTEKTTGQLVYNKIPFDTIYDAIDKEDFFDYILENIVENEVYDAGTPEFAEKAREFLSDSEDFNSYDENYIDKLTALTEPRFAIFKLNNYGDLENYRGATTQELQERGLYIDRENYYRSYRGRLNEGETLDELVSRFANNPPKLYTGGAISASDVVAVKNNGIITSYYYNGDSFEQIPDFALSHEERIACRVISDKLMDIADSMLASDEMDDLGAKLFNYENAPKYSGSSDFWLFGNGMTADKFEELTTRYNNGEDIRAELAKGVYQFGGEDFWFSNFDNPFNDNVAMVKINVSTDDKGVIFTTQGGFQLEYSWEDLGEAVIQAARREYDRHIELNRLYREDREKNGSLYLAIRDNRTIYLNKISEERNNHTDYRLEYIEGKGTYLTAVDENNERVEVRDFSGRGYDTTIHELLDESEFPLYHDRFEVTGIEREPVFKVEAVSDMAHGGEALVQAYEKTERNTLIPRDVLYVGTFAECNDIVEDLRLGETSQAHVRERYEEKLQRAEDTRAAVEKFSDTLLAIRGGAAAEITENFNAPFEYVVHFEGDENRYYTKDMSDFKLRYSEENGFYVTCNVGDNHKDYVFHRFGDSVENAAYYLYKRTDGEIRLTDAPEQTESHKSYIEFGLLGNGITCFDTSREVNHDYPTVAHISNEGVVKYYEDDLSEGDKRLIEEQAAQQKQKFTEDWNKLPIESRYERILDEATHEQFMKITLISNGAGMDKTVRAFEHSVIFKDEPFPNEVVFRTPEEIYNSLSDNDRVFFDTSAYADILYIEGLVARARTNKPAEKIRLSDRERHYAEMFGIYPDEFRELIRYHEAELAKQTVTVGPDDLEVGDYVRGDGHIWRITGIDGDFAIHYENIDKSANASVQSMFGHWKESFVKAGFEYVSPAEILQIQEQSKSDVEETESEDFEEIPDEALTEDYTYGEQLQFNLFGEPMHEVETPERTIINGVDVEQALKNDLINRGSGYIDGKFRIEQFYREHKGDTKGFAQMLAKEYGIGGHSGEGKVWHISHDRKGINIEISVGEDERTSVSWTWSKVANRIAALIDNQEYITQHDIDLRIKYAARDIKNNAPDTEKYKYAAAILDEYGVLEQNAPPAKKISAREEDNYTVNFSFISENADSIKAVKDFALSTGATVRDVSSKSLKSGLYGVDVDTWESRATEIKDFAVAQGISDIHEWGVHQVIVYDWDGGADEKYNYRSFSEATEAAKKFVEGTMRDTYDTQEKYEGAVVFNTDTKKIELVVGDFPVERAFSKEVLEANGISEPKSETVTDALPTITCNFSESAAFESGKTYSVAEFDAIMRKADEDYVAGRNAQIAKYGSQRAWDNAIDSTKYGDENYYEVARFVGYDKVDFTITMPDGTTFRERQDVGDGYGGVIDYLRHFPKFNDIVPILENARELQSAELAADTPAEAPKEEETAEQEVNQYKSPADIKAGDSFMYRGKVVTVTDDKGIYPDDIVITHTDSAGGFAYAVTNNVDIYKFAKEALYIPPPVQEQSRAKATEQEQSAEEKAIRQAQTTGIKATDFARAMGIDVVNMDEPTQEQVPAAAPERAETSKTTSEKEQTEEAPVEIKNLAQLKRALTEGAEFEITSSIRPDVVNQLRRVNYADTTGIYSIRPDAPDDEKTSLANDGRGSYMAWYKAADWEFSGGTCTAYRRNSEHTEEHKLFTIKVLPRVREQERGAETQQTAETVNPYVAELSKTYPTDLAEQLYNAFEGAKMADWDSNQAKINKVKRALYDVLGNEEQTEQVFDVLNTVETRRSNTVKDVIGKLKSIEDSGGYSDLMEDVRVLIEDRNGDSLVGIASDVWLEKLNELSIDELRKYADSYKKGTLNAYKLLEPLSEKNDYTITDAQLGEGSKKEKYAANVAAIRLLKTIEAESRLATPEEQETLSKYVGWGGVWEAFDPRKSDWQKEYKELRELLTEDEYRKAIASTENAHYTTPLVTSAIYKALQNFGFEGGNILEPAMGVGNFFGCMPEKLRKNSYLSGVELDSISGRIAQQLYQSADIQIKGFEKTEFSDNYFDAVVGNVPFGSYGVSDKRYNRENFFIHDYFLAKSLDKLAPGGIMAVVTSKGTLDKQNPKVREYLAKRADLVGAIRLPGGKSGAFYKNAGTEVTTDILFLQKREKMAVELPDWCYIGNNADGIPVNNYFIDHPEMILGTMKQGIEFSMHGNPLETACVPDEGADLGEQLDAAVATLKLQNAIRKHTEQRDKQAGVIAATADVRNFTFAEVDGKMYFRENNIMTEATDNSGNVLTGKTLERIRALNELRQTFRTILTAQENDCSDAQLEAYQKILNNQYDAFVKKYGYINDRANYQAFSKDDDYNSLCALELVDEETKEVTKSAFFSKRTVKQHVEITHVDTPQEALHVSIDTLGELDINYMAQLCGREPEKVVDALKADNLIFLNPKKANPDNPLEGWEEASEYLSGNVRIKLRAAERAAESNPEFQRNMAALNEVIPPKLEAGDITARIGVHWVDCEDYQKFAEEYAKARFSEPLRRSIVGEYKIEGKGRDMSAASTQIYGTGRMTAMEIFENLLNNRDVVVRDKVIDPETRKERYELNKKETELAQDKALKMKEAFKRWLWADPARREKYVERYNELFNCIVGRKYDGSRQTFPGMSPAITLKPHQLDAVMRAKFGGNTLLAHCVGAGKSFEMVAATMEKKRLGLINKACVVVPKSLVGQMASEWLTLYPQAKILTATEKDFDKDHRQKFIGRCCTGDYDAVIMSYEQFEKIPMSFEYRRDFIQREIDTLTDGIEGLKAGGRASENNGSIKDMERQKKRLEARLTKLIEDNGKTKDTSLTFEQLGFDSLVVDEAHNYKNGLVVTKMQRVAGVQSTPAQKSEDILMKTQFLNENYGERNLLFATGTPVSNSMTELYTMQRYLRPSLLEQAGLQTFDDWASTFGEVVSKAELKPAGDGYRTKKRFAKFNNLPELMAMYKEFADIQTADMLDLPVPKIESGKPQTIVTEPNDFQKAYMKILAERSENCHSGRVDASKDNMLKITGEARLLGLDARCLNPEAQNYPDSKVNALIENVLKIYTATTERKGVQAIFCDIAVHGDNETEEQPDSKKKSKKAKSEKGDEGKFSVYNYIKAELIRRGVPADEICFAGDADTNKKQNEMRAQLRSGAKRIVIASTSKLGTGANIQTKLCALHNLDIPWKPSDLEQRTGRIVRQGNENDTVGIFNYVTKNTFDAYLMNIIVTKQKFISQLMSGKTPARTCEDVDEMVLNYSEIQALASGDPRIKEKIELDNDVARLKMLENAHYNEQYRLDDTIKQAQTLIKTLDRNIEAAKRDLAYASENKPDPDKFRVEIGGKVYTERKEAGEALREAAVAFMADESGSVREPIGSFCGFELSVEKIRNGFTVSTGIAIRKEITYTTDMDITGDIGNITRLENLFKDGVGKKITLLEERKTRTEGDLEAALSSKGKPFEHAEELAQKSARLEQLNLELEVGKADDVVMNENEDEDEEQDGPDRDTPEKDAPDNDRDKPTPPKHSRH